MTRCIHLSRGGKLIIHNVEWCPDCNADPKQIEADEYDQYGYPIYTCSECGCEWAASIHC